MKGKPRNDSISCELIIVLLGFVAGLFISLPLWFRDRAFPEAPLGIFVGRWMPYELLFILLVISIAASAYKTSISIFTALIVFFYISLDINRLQPWVYQYSAMFLIAYLAQNSEGARRCFRYMIASIYLWSGIHKLAPSYFQHIFPWLISPFPFMRELPLPLLGILGLVSPFVEIFSGACLLRGKFVHLAALILICMHIGILIALGPFGNNWNHVVWPWNGVMIALLYLLFLRRDEFEEAKVPVLAQAALLAFCFVIPLLSVWGIVNRYMGFALYSGNPYEVDFTISEEGYAKLPNSVHRASFRSFEDPSLWMFEALTWSIEETAVPTSPSREVAHASIHRMCELLRSIHEPKKIVLVERSGFLSWSEHRTAVGCS